MKMIHLSSLLLLVLASASGCNRPQAQANSMGPPPAPEVAVRLPITDREVVDYEDFPGRTDAVYNIDIRARATGYVDRVNFKEGTDVNKGDLLFEIDARPYEADLKKAEATLVQARAHLDRLNLDFRRALDLRPTHAIGQEDFDKVKGDREEASAAAGVADASREMAALNLSYTKVRAPISGRISRRNIDPGNLVKADETILTNIVSLDPMYAYFDVDEHTTLRLQRLMSAGKISWGAGTSIRVLLGLADEEKFTREGSVDFADNSMDSDTGTWRLRARFANADHLLSRGMYVRIRVKIGAPYRAILVPEQAVRTDQGQKSVYVVDANSKIVDRRVKVGRLHDGQRVVLEGLGPKERIVVSGLQRVREGMEVKAVPYQDPHP